MLRRSFLASCVAAGAFLAFEGEAAEIVTSSPVATITTLQQGLIAAADDGENATIEGRYRALEPLIVATHDLPYIAEFALRRQWGELAESDRERFIAAFRRLSVMTYAARFKAVGASTFRPIADSTPAGSSGRAEVSTAVARADMPDVSLEYLLEERPDGWRIINVVADGVSDLALKRAEYQRLYAGGGIEALIAELERQTERLSRG